MTTETLLHPHPLAKLFRPFSDEEIKTLAADIAANGLHDTIVLYQGKVLEGWNRYRGCLRAKVEPRFEEFKGDEAAAVAFVRSKNVIRRHLKAKEQRDAIAALIKLAPEKSDRALAAEMKVDKNVVSRVRKKAESTGAVAPVEKRVGKDGKTRKQPTRARDRAITEKATLKPPLSNCPMCKGSGELEAGDCGTRPGEGVPVPCPCRKRKRASMALYSRLAKMRQRMKDEAADPPPPEPQPVPAAADRLTLLCQFAHFVINRARVSVDPKDHADWKALLGRVKQTSGVP